MEIDGILGTVFAILGNNPFFVECKFFNMFTSQIINAHYGIFMNTFHNFVFICIEVLTIEVVSCL